MTPWNRPSIILYHAWSSSASRKVRLCLAAKGQGYEGKVLNLGRFQHHADWYKKLNPSGIVPCMLFDGRPLVESNLINEFLDELFPDPPLMPDDPFARHEIRRFSRYVDDVCLPAVQKPNWMRSMRPIAEKWTDAELEERLAAIPTQARRDLWRRMARDPFNEDEVNAALDILEDMTMQLESYLKDSGGPWLFGAQLTLADLNVAPYVIRFEEERPGRLKHLTAAWWSRLTDLPCWHVAEISGFEADNQRSRREMIEGPV